ncbi:hypothetical protein PUR49_12915 [Streptomyces sp. BE147]|uniref:hypothetical protein n=1 Tax=Streptomyces sp. BE147 TaxID=3002524 RepID=UPI002E75F088|nr:hypothetical protein [Streptomyces sp. BE147]MEE1737389.1 hypothetical protein [Streptomyces sp. BE147]
MTSTTRRIVTATALTGAALFAAASPQAAADSAPATRPATTTPAPVLTVSAPALAAAHEAATSALTLETLSRFFAREGAVTRAAAAPRVGPTAVPVRTLSADFVAGRPGAALSTLDYLASTAVSSDGQKASLWTVPKAGRSGDWQVVNIATGDDEARYAAAGARKLPGGTVFREPQIDAWYVHKGAKVLPLDEDAAGAVGAEGTTLSAYRDRVREAYGDKLPGSGYARSGKAGGYGPGAATGSGPGPVAGPAEGSGSAPALAATAEGTPDGGPGTAPTATSAAAGAGALLVLALCGITAARRHRRTRETPVTGA